MNARGDGGNVDLVTNDSEIDQLVVPAALERDANGSALRPAQLPHGIVAGPPFGLFAFNLGDDVAAPQALLIGWRAFEQRDDGNLAIHDGDGDAETVYRPSWRSRICA